MRTSIPTFAKLSTARLPSSRCSSRRQTPPPPATEASHEQKYSVHEIAPRCAIFVERDVGHFLMGDAVPRILHILDRQGLYAAYHRFCKWLRLTQSLKEPQIHWATGFPSCRRLRMLSTASSRKPMHSFSSFVRRFPNPAVTDVWMGGGYGTGQV